MDHPAAETYGLQQHIGWSMTDWSDGFARLELPLEPFLMNRFGILHGGIHGVMADTAMGFAGTFSADPDQRPTSMTLSMTVNFVGQLQGKVLIAEGRRTGGGRRTYFAEARLSDELGTLGATATGVFRMRGA